MIELEHENASDLVLVRGDHPIARRCRWIERYVARRLSHGRNRTLVGPELIAPGRPRDTLEAEDDVVASGRGPINCGGIVVADVVVGQQAHARLAWIDRFLDLREQCARRIESQVARANARWYLPLALEQELVGHDHDQVAANGQLRKTAADKAAVIHQALKNVVQDDARLLRREGAEGRHYAP